MPFDELRRRALDALADRRESYHSAVATAVDEVRSLLDAQRAPTNGAKGERAAAELGVFAAGRIDVERFEALFSGRPALDADALHRVEEALKTLTGILTEGEDLHIVKVASGGDLQAAVRNALARAGRAFGAGRAVEHARRGTVAAEYAEGFDPTLWSPAERSVAPPLVVQVDGADLRPAGLVDFLEGGQAIVLLVKKPAPPAALARLITPGTLVAQGEDGDALDALASWDGPTIVAVAPQAAVFRYRPQDGGPGELTVMSVPEGPSKAIGRVSAARQDSDLALLDLLASAATGRVVAAAGATPAETVDPTDRLAAWLLRQATIPEPGAV